jgi:hypothetical protein
MRLKRLRFYGLLMLMIALELPASIVWGAGGGGGPNASPSPSRRPPRTGTPGQRGDDCRRVMTLLREGRRPVDVAHQLGLPIGVIESCVVASRRHKH